MLLLLHYSCINLTDDEEDRRLLLLLPERRLLLLFMPLLARLLLLLLLPLRLLLLGSNNELVPSSTNVYPKACMPDQLPKVVVRKANQNNFKLNKAGMHDSLPASTRGAASAVSSHPIGDAMKKSVGMVAKLCAASTKLVHSITNRALRCNRMHCCC